MAETASRPKASPVKRILNVLKLDRQEISAVYFYAILNGLVQLSLPLGIQAIISFVLGGSISTSLVILIVLVVLGVFITGLLQVNQMKLIERVQQKLFARYALEYAGRIPRLDMNSIDSYYLPELVNRFFDSVTLQKGISKLLLDIPTATIQILFGLILLSAYHPIFIFFSFLLIVLVIIILQYTGTRGLETSLTESLYKYRVAGWLEELARVIRSFKFSKGTKLNFKRTDELLEHYLDARTKHFRILLFQYWTLIGFKVLITAAMLIVGSVLLINQQLNLGQFIAAEIVILLVLSSVEKLIVNLDKVYDVLTSVDKLGVITDKPTDSEGGLEVVQNMEGMHVRIDQLSFGYNSHLVLQGVTVDIQPGKKVMVMGGDGSGKSTFLRMLTGVYPEFKGSILIDDIPIVNYQQDQFRKQVGVLFSQQEIFYGTLLENITMGDETIHPDTVMQLARKLGLEDFLRDQPDGFKTQLDPTGRRLSRSVSQKILLLRALINHPRLLLLEEPWRGLDQENKAKITHYIFNECKNETVFVESNDLQLAPYFDDVLYFEEGTLKYRGLWSNDLELKLN